jgi:hypothetical protein
MCDDVVGYDPMQYLQKVMVKTFPSKFTPKEFTEYRSSVAAAFREHWMNEPERMGAVTSKYYGMPFEQCMQMIDQLYAFTDMPYKDYENAVQANTFHYF